MEDILEKARQLSLLKLSQKTPSYKRFLYDTLKNTKAKIIGIYGARGVEKTTLMIHSEKFKFRCKTSYLYILRPSTIY